MRLVKFPPKLSFALPWILESNSIRLRFPVLDDSQLDVKAILRTIFLAVSSSTAG